jgi:hypothetical protein
VFSYLSIRHFPLFNDRISISAIQLRSQGVFLPDSQITQIEITMYKHTVTLHDRQDFDLTQQVTVRSVSTEYFSVALALRSLSTTLLKAHSIGNIQSEAV